MLATLFYFLLRQPGRGGYVFPVKAAVVADGAYERDAGFRAALEEVSRKGKTSFELSSAETREEADALLENGDVDGYLTVETASRS